MGLGVLGGTYVGLGGGTWVVGLGVFNVGLMWDLLVGLDQWDLGGTWWWDLCGGTWCLQCGTWWDLCGTC